MTYLSSAIVERAAEASFAEFNKTYSSTLTTRRLLRG
jgi:hypothetical protein